MELLIDIHTHNQLSDQHIHILSLEPEDFEDYIESTDVVLCSVGIHPWKVHLFTQEMFQKLETIANHPIVKTIGECGLDKNAQASIENQISVFEKHIILSEKNEKPLIIHCVGCFNELIALKKKWQPKQNWIVHGFRSKPELALQLLENGFALSFGEKYNEDSLRLTPLDKLCIETDESDLDIETLYERAAEIKNCQPEDLTGGYHLLNILND